MQYQDDRARTDRLIADTEYLMREIASLRIALGEVATRDFLRSELRDLLDDLDERETPSRKKKRTKQAGAADAEPLDTVDAGAQAGRGDDVHSTGPRDV